MTTAVKPKKPTTAVKAAGKRAPGASATTAPGVRAKAARAKPGASQAGTAQDAAPAAQSVRVRAKPAAAPAPAEKVKKPAVRTGALPVKLNKRSGDTIAKILATTEEIILQSGADRISILDVCQESGISRGTFYRYFSSQDDLLDAFSRHKRDQFHARLIEAVGPYQDPDERFQAVLNFVDDYLERSRARRLLLVAPDYATRWFQRIFHDSVHRFQDVLSPVFDAWEERRGITLDRELICELIVRFILSDVLVPSGADRRNLMRRVERFVIMLLSGRVARR
ncbi:AcrR family transcriptional regulator [Massilia sp. UYP11]|uniref:TetR/AcrR family transcriptional regulator n=1 Tax=Massilia sp. UYP11 TaxID=1756385 RepID=UPI003D1DBB22